MLYKEEITYNIAILLKNLLYGRTGSVLDNYISQFLIKDDISRIQTYNLLSLKLAYIYIRHLYTFSSYLLPKIILLIYLIPLNIV